MEKNSNDKYAALKVYAELMIEKMKEVGESGWKKPWFSPGQHFPPESLAGRKYNRFNRFFLDIVTERNKYKTPVFTTFRGAMDEGFSVNKGAKGHPIVHYGFTIQHKETKEKIDWDKYSTLSTEEKSKYNVFPHLKHYTVFNLDQTNYAEKFPEKFDNLLDRFTAETEVISDGYVNKNLYNVVGSNNWLCPINIEKQDHAFYSPRQDSITLPQYGQFTSGKEFYYTALHEMAHSTGMRAV